MADLVVSGGLLVPALFNLLPAAVTGPAAAIGGAWLLAALGYSALTGQPVPARAFDAKCWLHVLTELCNHGVPDVLASILAAVTRHRPTTVPRRR
ncbi:hypothetical protein [Saccharothrix sp. NRRL B-16348]|uniref:hypothetical protein n=1 Tax=Saccharothrix sp. NRRL B-16348 TaxID=1415542 RepID=UPI0012F88D3B|nr:hypothetical protein [Saccharothrix sp. NRRL B-16348]